MKSLLTAIKCPVLRPFSGVNARGTEAISEKRRTFSSSSTTAGLVYDVCAFNSTVPGARSESAVDKEVDGKGTTGTGKGSEGTDAREPNNAAVEGARELSGGESALRTVPRTDANLSIDIEGVIDTPGGSACGDERGTGTGPDIGSIMGWGMGMDCWTSANPGA